MNKKGFTLIEMLGVIIILGLIIAVITQNVLNNIKEAKEKSYSQTVERIQSAAQRYIFDNDIIIPAEEGSLRVVPLDALKNYLDNLIDARDNSVIYGYVKIMYLDNQYVYQFERSTQSSDPLNLSIIGGTTVDHQLHSVYSELGYFAFDSTDGDITGDVEVTGSVDVNTLGQYIFTYKVTNSLGTTVTKTRTVNVTFGKIDVLVVAGGGGGGFRHGGGGGAGGLIFNSTYNVGMTTSVTVGAGGLGSTGSGVRPANGGNSVFGTLTAIGGGGGAQWDTWSTPSNGGSGGGSVSLTIATGTAGQGNSGGKSASNMNTPYNHGGGGGAGAKGGDGTATAHGSGGVGLYYGDIFGDNFGENGWFAGGGGGGGHNPAALTRGLGGMGGGGDGGTPGTYMNGENGMNNTGGGGGGASTQSSGTNIGGNGGSGIVIVRYAGPQRATGGTVSTFGDYTIHTFTSGTSSFVLN